MNAEPVFVDRMVEIRQWRLARAERAAVEAAWLLAVRGRLRQGQAITRELADAASVNAGLEFSRFLTLLKKHDCFRRVGQRIGPSGHLNDIWEMVAK